MAAPGFQTWGGNCGANVLTGGATQKFDAIRVGVLFNAIGVFFINVGFCMFNNDNLLFFARELFFFLIIAIGRFICCSFRLQGSKGWAI